MRILIDQIQCPPERRQFRISRSASGFQFGDFHAEFLRAFHQMFPRKCLRPLRGELIAHPHRIVVVEQHEIIADRAGRAISG